eukprot:m.132973 g.132973  ORF g.132973 m.132973 type:complete len:426 (-) comp29644_c0_seq2:296-1573(-)
MTQHSFVCAIALFTFMVVNGTSTSQTQRPNPGSPCKQASSMCKVSICAAPPRGCVQKPTPTLVFNKNGVCCALELCEYVRDTDNSVGCGFQKPIDVSKQSVVRRDSADFVVDADVQIGSGEIIEPPSQVGLSCDSETGPCPTDSCMEPPQGCIINPISRFVITSLGACCRENGCELVKQGDFSPCVEVAVTTTTMSPKGNIPAKGYTAGQPCLRETDNCPMARCRQPPVGCVSDPTPPLEYTLDGNCCERMCAMTSEADTSKPCVQDEHEIDESQITTMNAMVETVAATINTNAKLVKSTEMLTPPVPLGKGGLSTATPTGSVVINGVDTDQLNEDEVKSVKQHPLGTGLVIALLVVLFAMLSVMAAVYQRKAQQRNKRSLLENVRSSIGTSVQDDKASEAKYEDPEVTDVSADKNVPRDSETCA